LGDTAGRRALDVTFFEYQFDAGAATDDGADTTPPDDRRIEEETTD